jgi:hypothetical protein
MKRGNPRTKLQIGRAILASDYIGEYFNRSAVQSAYRQLYGKTIGDAGARKLLLALRDAGDIQTYQESEGTQQSVFIEQKTKVSK